MRVSIAIPTHNRADELRLTLDSLSRIDASSVEAREILVVGNCCNDDTAAVVAHFGPAFGGRLRYLEEENLGLNHARNRAVSEARFQVVALLDDDVEVDRNWLSAVVRAFESEGCAAVGGKAYLIYPQARPRWLDEKSEGLLSKVELGSNRRQADAEELYGLNLSIQKDWLARVGPFRPDLDRVGSCLISGGETELLQRIALAGGRLIYEPAALVGHRVPASRLRRKWFWSRCYWGGLGMGRVIAEEQLSLRTLRRPTWHLARTTWHLVRASLRHGPGSPECFYQSTRWAAYLGNCVATAARLWRRGRSALPRAAVES